MKIIFMSLIVLFINVSCFGVVTQKDDTDRMIFIKVKMENGTPTAIDYEILPGKVKTPKVQSYKPNDLFFEVTSKEENVISEGTVADLSNNNYEYVDENGELKNVEVESNSTEVVVRVNYDERISIINLYKIPDNASLKKSKNEFIPLASFNINLN